MTDNGTGYTQVFTQANTDNITGTWGLTGATAQSSTPTSSLPARGSSATTFTPALPSGTVVAQIDTGPPANCTATTTTRYCSGSGTITVNFSKPVNNPVFHIAGLGGGITNGTTGAFVTSYSAYGTLSSVPSGATLGTPASGSTSLEVVNGNQFRTSVNQPGVTCDAPIPAGCGSMVVNGTGLTQISFAMGLKVFGGTATLTATNVDAYNAFVTLQDQPVPVAAPDTNTTKRNTPVTTSILTNDAPSAGKALVPGSVVLSAPGIAGATVSTDGKTLTVQGQGVYSVITTGAAIGQVVFTPVATFVGTATPINYRVSDSDNSTATSTLTVTVTADPPGPVADTPTTSQGVPVTFDPTVNDNGVDSPINKASVRLLDPATGQFGTTLTIAGEGTYTVSAAGDVTFTPVPAFSGTARPVTYRVANQSGATATSTITPTVTLGVTITVRKNLPTRTAANDQFTLSLRTGTTVLASVTTSGTATGIQETQIRRAFVQPGSTYTISEAQTTGAGLGYSNAYECTRAGTVIASGSGAAGTITMPNEAGTDVTCTFTNTAQTARLFCDTNHFYSITTAGALEQGDIVSGGLAPVGTWPGVAGANALGIGSGGNVAYAIDQSADRSDVTSILKWTPGGGFATLTNTSYLTVAGGVEIAGDIVAGAVDPKSGRFLFGKFVNQRFHIWSFTDTLNAPSFAYVGSFPTGTAPNGNGDMAFDADGNLSVIGAATVSSATNAAIYTVTAKALADGGDLVMSTSTVKQLSGTDGTFTDFRGVAFSPRGTVYLADATSAYEFDATTWSRVSGTPRIPIPSTSTSFDLASCSSPATITVQKNVVGRQSTNDQFTLTVAVGSPSTAVATATTSGAANGPQAAQIGPFPVPIGTAVTINEAMAGTSASPITAYTTIYECYSDGVRLSTGTTATGTVTIPNRLSAAVNCTYFNSPAPVSSVQITKTIQEFSGLPRPGVGWTVGTTATAGTTGSATALPSQALTQPALTQQTNAEGRASWTVLYGSTTSRATIVVSEVQQTGFAFVSGSCRITLNGISRTVTITQIGSTIGANLTDVAPSSTVECQFVNRPTSSLTLVKQVAFGSAQPTDWTLSATGPNGALPGPSGRSGSAAASGIAVTPGAAYRLSETGGPLTYVQTGAWQCRTGTGAAVDVTAAGEVTPIAGATITCTVTNSTASITLLKQVQNPRAGFRAPDWRVTATPAALAGGVLPTESRLGAEYVASGNPANTFFVRPGHGYTLSEAATDPTRPLAYQELRLEQLTGSTWTLVPSRTISAPAAGQTAVYRFVNAPVEPTRLPLTGGTSTDAYYIGGGLLLILALALLVWHGRRRMRGAFR
ncbi:Ig-like domain-containing protein [Arthrobacter agilis]|uniref:Ig-like domain-containing protein n=1 Tax=Arthrobacter agilis TaxID=37921 RepID=UPI0027D7D0C3|nr:Ig-like domain-containing protein [Arthrobacter agilis]